ncbi:tetratricopeptide repeat protein [Pantanalinema rosaneae CENA516]|uniref:tetratricopeptide repeat protein n=1 Tax=Pantanalinema rosaneae TaxID=1620701 RepID=UPI003D6FF71C
MDNHHTHLKDLETVQTSTSELEHTQTDLASEAIDLTQETSASEPVTTTLTTASAGITGAVIGHLIGKHTVGGRVGATIGAVVGSVAGAALGKEVSQNDTVDSLAHTAKEAVGDTVEQVKTVAEDTCDRAKDVVPGMKATAPDRDQSEPEAAIGSTDSAKHVEPSRASIIPSDLLSTHSDVVAQTHYHVGLTLGRQGKLEQAIQEFQEVLDVMPESAETYYNLGVALNKQGDVEQALDHMYQARELCVEQDKVQGVRIVDQAIAAIRQHYPV